MRVWLIEKLWLLPRSLFAEGMEMENELKYFSVRTLNNGTVDEKGNWNSENIYL